MASLTITLPDELSKYVEEQVAAGRGTSVAEFIGSLIATDQRVPSSEEFSRMILAGAREGEYRDLTPAFWDEQWAKLQA